MIIKLINQGVTTTITREEVIGEERKGYIIFEGKKYELQGVNIAILEEIASAVINQEKDVLAKQYKEHDPIFPRKLPDFGMKQAAADIKDKGVKSIFDHSKDLTSIIITKLANGVIYKETRDVFGLHKITKYYYDDEKLEIKHMHENPNAISPGKNGQYSNDAIKRLENTLGEYKGLSYYKALLIEIPKNDYTTQELEEMITIPNGFQAFTQEKKILFQQTLVGMGYSDYKNYTLQIIKNLKQQHKGTTDDLNYISDELGKIGIDVYTDAQEIRILQIQQNITSIYRRQADVQDITQVDNSYEQPLVHETSVALMMQNDQNIVQHQARLCPCCPSRCQIFSVTKIKYDNPLLNHQNLFKALSSKMGFNYVLNQSHKLVENGYTHLIDEAISNGSVELLLGSIDYYE